MTQPATFDDLRARVAKGLAARQALDFSEPYFAKSRAAHVDLWARSLDPTEREELWYAVRAHDVLLKRMRDEIEQGKAAEGDLRHRASLGEKE